MPKGSVPLLLLALPVFLIFLDANSIWDANEAFYVETPRQMVLSGDFVSPTFNDEPRYNKPVLSYWIVAGLYHLFGISVGVERLGIALGALGIIWATFVIGRAARSVEVGVLAALVMATAPRFVMYSRRIFIDIYTTLFMVLALACFALAERHPEHRRRYLVLMYVAIGLGVLTKGPVALVLPAAAFGVWLVMEQRLRDLGRLMLVPGAAIVLAIVLPWGIAMHGAHGWGPLLDFLGVENIERFSESVAGDRPIWFFLPVLLGDLFPWGPLAAVPLFLTAWRSRSADEPVADASLRRLLWLWVVVIVGAFTLSATKQDLYILPVMPAVAVLIADALLGAATGLGSRLIGAALVLVGVLSLVAAVAAVWLVGDGYYALRGAVPAAAVLAATGLAVTALSFRGGHGRAVTALAAGFVVFNYLFVAVILPDVERFKPIPAIAATFTARAAAGARLGAFGTMLPSLVYYAGRPVEEQPDLDAAAAFMSNPGEAWMLVETEEWAGLQARVEGLCVAERRHLFAFNEKAATIIGREPPPELLLVTKCAGARRP